MDHLPVVLAVLMIINIYSTRLSLANTSCTPTNYVRFRDRVLEGVPRPNQVSHPGQFLANAYIFGCHGVVTKWKAYTFDSGAHPIEFHVWRANETVSNVYHLVGINIFQNARPDVNRLISLPVPPEEQIVVSPGDFAGIRTIESLAPDAGDGFRIQFDNGGTYRQYIPPPSVINYSTPSVLDLRLSGGFSSATVGSRSPIITALVSELVPTTMAPTSRDQRTTESETSEATPLPQSTIIAIAASAGVLFLAAAFILIVTLLMCCLLHKKTMLLSASNSESHPATNRNLHNSRLVTNVAYNYDRGGIQLTNNPSYNEANNSWMVNNEECNKSGNDEPYYSVVRDEVKS